MTGVSPGMVQTVTGPVAPRDLGPTLMHEHVFCDVTPPDKAAQLEPEVEITLENVWDIRYLWSEHAGNQRLGDEDLAVAELARFRAAGGDTLVELTCTGIRPDPVRLRRASARSGVRIVMGCGHYVEAYMPPAVRDWPMERYRDRMLEALGEGDAEGGVQAGIIGEIGCSDPWTDTERRVMKAAVEAQRATGAAINVHPGRTAAHLFDVVDFVRAEGGDVARLILSHIDRTVFDEETLFRLADTGVVIEYDFFGIESTYYPFRKEVDLPNDGMRLRMIRRLVERGHAGQIAISQDICTRTRLRRFGGHGYGHILDNVVPLMRYRGFSEEVIHTILVGTPRRLLALA